MTDISKLIKLVNNMGKHKRQKAKPKAERQIVNEPITQFERQTYELARQARIWF